MIDIFVGGFVVTQGFGEENTHPAWIDWYRKNGLKGHEGLDIVPANTVMDWRVFSPIDGKVVKANNDLTGPYGRYVTIWNKKLGFALQLCHLEHTPIIIGSYVKRGGFVGVMGGTAYTEEALAPHTHINKIPTNRFGIRNGDTKNGYMGLVDPLPTLRSLSNV